ncbi:MAG TPA: GspE/PulE family protein [Verrucomicrobiales bacterium]|nr:GspE/PulE family protein [Verrucomicrobiales bacterium]
MGLIPLLTEAARQSGCSLPETCQAVLKSARRRRLPLIDALLDARLVNEARFFRALSAELNIPFMESTSLDLSEPLHTKFPAKLALRHRVLPAQIRPDGLTVMTYNPFDLEAKQNLGQEVAKPVVWVLGTRHYILESLRLGYGVGAANFDELIEGREGDDSSDALAQEVSVLDNEDEATVMSFVNQVFREALNERATDIHVEPLERDLRIRYRVDGSLQEVKVPPNMRLLQASLISRLKIMAQLDIAERRLPQDGRINLEVDGDRIDVRVATIPSVNGESVSLRILSREKFDFEALGLEEGPAEKIRRMLKLPNGIILVTGPTGSGKSTTLYTFLRVLNTADRRIVTIEDPVENKLDGVVQIAVKPEIELTFASGLRSILRGDPNVIMVGEMRDVETAEIAIRGALTGHLVFSTLHTNDAVGGIHRLLDMGIEPFLIASSVRCFLAQRLVRKLCEECKAPAQDMHDGYLEHIGFPRDRRGGLMRVVGCRECRGTGYHGRMALMEICEVTPAMQDLIAEHASASALRAKALEEGMTALRDDGWNKAAQGLTTIDEVLAVTAGDNSGGSRDLESAWSAFKPAV